MQIHPSLLEYSSTSLSKKIEILYGINYKYIHIDFIGKQFAQNLHILKSLDLISYFKNLLKDFDESELLISIHLMIDLEDLADIIKELHVIKDLIPSQHNIIIYIPKQYLPSFLTFKKRFKIGFWWNLNCYNTETEFTEYNLLMLVSAGLSGQKQALKDLQAAEDIAKKNPQLQFLFDGGMNIDYISDCKNINIISYKSFWSKYPKLNLH